MLKHSNGFINVVFLFCLTIKYSGFLVSCIFSHHPTLWIHFHLETSSEMDDFGPSLSSAACYFSSRRCDATLETWRLLQEKWKKSEHDVWTLWFFRGCCWKLYFKSSFMDTKTYWLRVRAWHFLWLLIRQSALSTSGKISLAPVAVGPVILYTFEWHFSWAKIPPAIFWIKIWYDSLLA